MKARFKILFPLATLATFTSCQQKPMTETLHPPTAKKVPRQLEAHGTTRTDNYFWMNDREDTAVINHLKAENAYTEAMLADVKDLRENLYKEMRSRIKETDESVPYMSNGYLYYTRFEEGKEYPIFCRKKAGKEAPEEVILDENKLAEGHAYCDVSIMEVSPDNRLLAFAIDTVGRRMYTLHIKDLTTGQTLPDAMHPVTGCAWANDNKTLFYGVENEETLRSHRIFRHTLGTQQKNDVLIHDEVDETFSTFVYRNRSGEKIIIGSNSTLTSEYRALSTNDPNGTFKVVQPRERGIEYSIEFAEGQYFIVTNWQARNFRIMTCKEGNTTKENWKELIAHRDSVLVEGIDVFKSHMVISERNGGLPKLRVMGRDGSNDHYIDMGESTYTLYPSTNDEYDTKKFRFGYSSLTTPNSTFDYDLATKTKELLKQQPVLGGFDPKNYQAERLMAKANDGTLVPISLVYHKDKKQQGNPLLLYGYGSYGATMDAYFSSARLSLLDRGFIFAIAHIRGGQEMGRFWYEDGKLLKKKNTFTDFINCAEHLIAHGYTDTSRLFAMGGSAGGLLMGAVANMRPDLWKGVLAAVPFVDVVTTMLDSTIPLTTGEYDEWGNPNQKEYFDYMLSYSPYDNVEAKAYPNMLVTTGLHDSQVQYWEPMKWVAKLRELKTDNNLLLLKTNMDAGHGGASGRFEALKEVALEWAFMLKLVGIKN